MNIRKVVYRVSCEVIYELMQRDLDEDLSHVEKQRLLTHLASCTQCSDLYERLYSLSTHLAQLPAVKPPVSIVQSIMPRLDEFDYMRAEHREQAAASETVEEGIMLSSKRKRFWFRSFAGAAAAAAVLTVTIWNMEGSPLQQTAFSPAKPKQVQERANVEGDDRPLAAQPPAANSPAAGESQVPSVSKPPVVSGQKPSVEKQADGAAESNAISSNKAESSAGARDDRASAVVETPPKMPDEKPVTEAGDKQQKAEVEEKIEKPSADSGTAIVQEQKPEKEAVAEQEVPRPDADVGKRNMLVGFASQEDAEKKTENHVTAAETEKSVIPRVVQEEYFVSKSGNRLIVRDGNGEIQFATHDWGDTYSVSYRWVGNTRILYTLDYQGAGMEIGPRPQTQEWLIDLNKNIERPLFK